MRNKEATWKFYKTSNEVLTSHLNMDLFIQDYEVISSFEHINHNYKW